MADYTNLTCPVCGKQFSENDDIVVCPICGSPHHRECYKTNGECANKEWHAENKVFNFEEEQDKIKEKNVENEIDDSKQKNDDTEMICPRCGEKNPSDFVFCSRCGAPISSGFTGKQNNGDRPQFTAPPFGAFVVAQDPNEDIGGVSAWKLSATVRENQHRFLSQFKFMTKQNRKTSFNIPAFLFGPYYFLYRKMYGLGVALLIVTAILDIPSLIMNFTNEALSEALGTTVTVALDLNKTQTLYLSYAFLVSNVISTVIKFLCGFFANWLYFKKCKKICSEIDEKGVSQDEFKSIANKKGGVNRVLIITMFILIYLVAFSFTFFISSGMFGV